MGIDTIRKMNMKVANEMIEQLRTIPGVSIFVPEDEKLRSSIVFLIQTLYFQVFVSD